MRLLRYFIGGFEALLAAFAGMTFAECLAVLIQLSLHPGVGAQRLADVRTTGQMLVGSVGTAIFGIWFARLAIRNFRDAKAVSTAERRPTGNQVDCAAKIRGIGRQVTVLSGFALFAGVMGYVQTTPAMVDLGHFPRSSHTTAPTCMHLWQKATLWFAAMCD